MMRCPAYFVMAGAIATMSASCKRTPPPREDGTEAIASPIASSPVAPEPVPRCRSAGARLPLGGEDVVVGEAAVVKGSLLVGVIRRDGPKRVASIVVTDTELASPRYVEVGPALGDDPPPVPYAAGADAFVVYFARKSGESASDKTLEGALDRVRELRLARLNLHAATLSLETVATVLQQADESLAFDVAWNSGDALVAWDEDAPRLPGRLFASRGLIKVQVAKTGAKAKVVSPDDSDVELPRLLPRKDGYWLAWLANRAEVDDAGAPSAAPAVTEGPGEGRAYRWVEIVTLDAKGDPAPVVRRVSPEKGRAVAFELAKSARGSDEVIVLVQDEAASAEGGGARIVRYALDGDHVESGDIVDGGVGAALAELVPAVDPGAMRWLSWIDTADRARMVPLGPSLAPAAPATFEPSLDGARPLVFAAPDVAIVVAAPRTQPADGDGALAPARVELARVLCR